MRQIRRIAYRTRRIGRQPPPPRWRRPALVLLLVAGTAGLFGAMLHLAQQSGFTERARFALTDRLIAATDEMGLRVADILSEGRQRTGTDTIYRILEPYYGQNILSVDISAIQQRLQSLPWIRQATVTRQLPDRLRTQLVEHRPVALWQPPAGPEGQPVEPALVSDQGAVIRVAAVSPYRHLPILSGVGAPGAAPDLLRMIDAEPALARRVTGAQRVDGRRWNVFVDGRIEVRLPERDAAAAWTRLAGLAAEKALLERAVSAVDLRLADRVVVRLADEILEPDGPVRQAAHQPGQST